MSKVIDSLADQASINLLGEWQKTNPKEYRTWELRQYQDYLTCVLHWGQYGAKLHVRASGVITNKVINEAFKKFTAARKEMNDTDDLTEWGGK